MFATYRKGNSLLHRIEARTKLLLTAGTGILVYLVGPPGLGGLSIVAVLLILVAGIPASSLVKGLRPMAVFFVLIFLTHLLMQGGGVVAAAIPVTRFVLLILFTTVLLHTTSQSELKTALVSLMKPLGGFGRELAFMVGVTMALIPGLVRDKETIARAQAARGCKPAGLWGFVALIVPLLRRSFKKADELSDALESRCYHRDREYYYYGGALARKDYLLLGGFGVVLVLILWVSV
ncbi:MAG: energy-coupling factor transporter transmembrane protein EcfT [Euryarchaeota archaeon]|nr:energy-coupling factor transporter transmembrane protein EcfT [Euryarchaeota archaeon]